MGLKTVVGRREQQDTRWPLGRHRKNSSSTFRRNFRSEAKLCFWIITYVTGQLTHSSCSSCSSQYRHVVMHAGYIIYLQSTRNLYKSSPNHLAWMRVRSLLIINGRKDVRFESRPPPQADRDPPPLPDPDPHPRPLPLPLPVPLQASCHRASSSQLG